jgi:hypothetical protein
MTYNRIDMEPVNKNEKQICADFRCKMKEFQSYAKKHEKKEG